MGEISYGPWYHVEVDDKDYEFTDEKVADAFERDIVNLYTKKYHLDVKIERYTEETDWT